MKKRRSKLQKRIDDPNSRLWKNKADTAWRKLVHKKFNNQCAICSSIDFTQAHHLIPRQMASHRHEVLNGVLTCARHHKYSFELSPHKAPVEFFKWLIANKPELWEWLINQKPTRKNMITYKETYEKLQKELDQILI